jgi:hypothetical protein
MTDNPRPQGDALSVDAMAVENIVKSIQVDRPSSGDNAQYQAGLWRGIVIGAMLAKRGVIDLEGLKILGAIPEQEEDAQP